MVAASGILYVVTIVLYSLSVFGYFIDFLTNNRKANKIAFWLLSIVWVLQTFFFITRALQYTRLPVITPFEGLFFYAWLLVSLSLLINRFFRIDFFVFFTNVVGFIMMAFSLFATGADVPVELEALLTSEVLFLHITFILLSYTAFTFAFVFSILYLLQHQMLKKKQWGKRLVRLGNLPRMEQLTFWMTVSGVPLLLVGLILGFVWAWIQFEMVPLIDAKIIGSLLVLLAYSIFLYTWIVKGKRGYDMMLWNVAGFLLVLVNYFLTRVLTDFHIWYV
ncbi:inner membrane protein YpjD [Aliibacillus thermotolerans]|uniref:Inner membrane protein YpjD n=1 Tax=Aliibacillus thermotolerans TaxID=1834418 RepID=A0ABW0UC94_9BACI|nr:cytochrome c biogenesis protein CcsA [Aliibacillus thermotolerans]MDA3128986.1 cytochrome C assembly protein [Aliibacillus thermotolerans]